MYLCTTTESEDVKVFDETLPLLGTSALNVFLVICKVMLGMVDKSPTLVYNDVPHSFRALDGFLNYFG